MILNYLKIAFRNLRRQKTFAALNIAGLAISLAATLVIFLVLQHEFSFDRYHEKADRIYHLVKKRTTADGIDYRTSIPFAATAALRNAYPQVTFAEIFSRAETQVTILDETGATAGKKFIERRGIFYAEPELFDLFDLKWISGNPSVLKTENQVAISRALAEKYFGNWQAALNKVVKIDNKISVRVAGVVEDAPVNTDFPFALLISYKTFLANHQLFGFNRLEGWNWAVSWHQVYALLPEKMNPGTFNDQVDKYTSGFFENGPETKLTYYFRPLGDIHFDTRFENNGDHVSSKTSLYTLFFIGVLILMMACINFVNLSTAMAAKRSKEVGVRKVLGGSQLQVKWQVLCETALIVTVAAIMALLLAQLALPYLKHVVVIQERLDLFTSGTIVFIVAIGAITILLSGIYPAFVLSRFKPVDAIRNKFDKRQIGGISLRRILVVMQFAFSQLLIIATIIAVSQMNFIRNVDLGVQKETVLILHGSTDSLSLGQQPAFKNELLKIPGVKSVSFTYDAPVSDDMWLIDFSFNNAETPANFAAYLKFGDEDYLETFGMQLVAGRFYKDAPPAEVVINETMVKKLGLQRAEEAVGKTIRLNSDGPWMPIAGVVRDFKSLTLRESIPPIIVVRNERRQRMTAIKLSAANISRAEQSVEDTWEKFYPQYAYNRRFLDETIDNFYRQERQMSNMYKIYALIAIIISCLGLYGLVSFMAVQKTKEVGIRKVLGASLGSIVYLFSKEFTLLVLVAFAIAAPVAWYMMNTWLQDFVFRIDIGAGVFAIAVLASVLIAWITVGYKALRAAMANPVKSLRTE